MDLPTDQELLTRLAQRGDRAALSQLVQRHQAGVFRFCRGLCRDTASAEDALQQTFLDLMRGAATFSAQSSFRAWLFTLARNACHRGARLRSGEPREPVPLQELGALAGWGESPEQAAARSLDRARLRAAIASLAPEAQEVLVLRDLEGLSGTEVARILDIGMAAQKSRLHRARLALSAALRAPQGAPDGP